MEVDPLLERTSSTTFATSSPIKSRDEKLWLAEVKKHLPDESVILEKEVIIPVPICLKNDKTELFYHPKEISIGPEHFRKKALPYDYALEDFKREVAQKFDRRLKETAEPPSNDGGLISVVEKFRSEPMQERLRKSYAMPYSIFIDPEVLSWLLARDSCFVIEVLHRFSMENQPENGQKTVWQHILNRQNHHPLLNDIVKDIFKLENQLPLWVLEEIKQGMGELNDNWFDSALENLSPIEVGSRTYNKKIHVLQLLGEYMVGNEAAPHHEEENHHNQNDEEAVLRNSTALCEEENHHNQNDEEAVLRNSTALCEEENHKKQAKCIIAGLKGIFFVVLFLLLSPVVIIWVLWLVIWLMWHSYQNYMWGKAEKNDRHVPTTEELDKIGVKFKKLRRKGISQIKFKEKKSTLYLPKFTVDDKSEVILRNLLVMETHWEDREKIITRYVVFMNDLVNTSKDVSLLRKEGIIVNNLGSDDDVARLWNSVTIPATDIPSYQPIDLASRSINDYCKKGLKILWAQFWKVHCSKPWLVASLLGGISLLSLTVVQVVCLFHNCEKG